MTPDLSYFVFMCVFYIFLSNAGNCFQLTILHTNDVHARIEQTNKYGGRCMPADSAANKCYGGVARRQTVIKRIRKTHPNVLLLDAGDQFQGTVWFTIYEGSASSFFMNQLNYDVMVSLCALKVRLPEYEEIEKNGFIQPENVYYSLKKTIGNHEFDMGPKKLVQFLRSLNFSVVASNIDVSREPKWPKNETLFNKSMIVEVGGEKIGIVGYLTKDTTWLSYPGDKIKFGDEVDSIRKEVQILKAKGINKFIALGHSGIEVDIAIAKGIPDIDIVVGGHTNTFMYTGKKPSREDPYGPYPFIVNPTERPTKRVLVVQDYTFGKYLGYLNVTFDNEGEVTGYSGNPILLNGSFEEDKDVLNEVIKRKSRVEQYSKLPLGRTHVFLDGRREICRTQECNMGNLITDAFVHMYQKHPDEKSWADVSIALWVSGGIRSSIDKKLNQSLTKRDIIEVLPFGNQADIIELKGEHLLAALEHSVSSYNPKAPSGQFLQMSGIHVQYDINQPVGQRVVNATVRCAKCRVPKYEPIDKTKIYKIIMSTWMRKGGDNFQMFLKHRIKLHPGEDAANLVGEYIDYITPIKVGLEERITFVNKPKAPGNCVCNQSKKYPCAGVSLSPPTFTIIVSLILIWTILNMKSL